MIVFCFCMAGMGHIWVIRRGNGQENRRNRLGRVDVRWR